MADRYSNDHNRGGRAMPDEARAVLLDQLKQQMRAVRQQRLLQLAEKHPNETLTILRSWMAQKNG